ncbi:secretoglobin family 1C member 1 [Tyto alba]|uniref:secretoglobin family 1C member 1 n=1 Tax=Tyto alba TaxID=56313 RepID=UPI001C67EF8C|nr:secretoglobin family 1C member 1 [Tyto alba]
MTCWARSFHHIAQFPTYIPQPSCAPLQRTLAALHSSTHNVQKMARAALKLTVALLITTVLCGSLGASSAHKVVPRFLQTLLEGPAEQLYTGPISQYEVDDLTRAALTALKDCINELSPKHVKALIDLLKLVRTEA